MKEWQGKRYWLVGASDGLGKELAMMLSRAGVELVLSARNEAALNELAAALPGKSQVAAMDIRSGDSVAAAAEAAGTIDGVVLMAGTATSISALDWDADKAVEIADTNFTGVLRVLGHVMPGLAERDAGHVVLVGSLAAYRGLARNVGYAASKAAVQSLAESMYADLRGTGIQVQIVNPGYFRTAMTAANTGKMPFLMEVEDAAREVFEHMMDDSFKKAFPAPLSWVVRLAQFLPDWLYYRTIGR